MMAGGEELNKLEVELQEMNRKIKMQIGIDLGATKIESVLLKENGLELHRNRIQSPKNYQKTISDITNIVNIEKKFKKNLNVGICHPGSNLETGFIQMP